MMIRPLERLSPIKRTTKPTHYGTRRSARSPALLTAVRSRRSGLAVHPRRVLHGPAAPDWRGELHEEFQRSTKNSDCEPSRLLDHAALGYPSCPVRHYRAKPSPASRRRRCAAVPDHDAAAHPASASCGRTERRARHVVLAAAVAPAPPLVVATLPPPVVATLPPPVAAMWPPLASPPSSPPSPPPPRLATVIVAVVVAATVGRRPRRRRSSLLLCRRRSPCHMSLAHRRRRLSAGVPLPRHRHPPRRRSSSPSPSLPPLGAASARPSRRRVHRPRQPCPPRPPPSHPPPTRPLSYLILSCEGGKFLNTPAFQTSRRAGLGR
jgi:hypothetical protein